MNTLSLSAIILASCVLYAPAAEIAAYARSGTITWSNTVVAGSASIEWAASLEGPWYRSWPHTAIPITSAEMSSAVPMFYRIVRDTYAPLDNALVPIPYDESDKAYFLQNQSVHPNGFQTYQKGGPEYAFFMQRYEVSNAEFAAFLNSAEANQTNERGTNILFQANGDLRLPSENLPLFDLSSSRLTYSTNLPVGSRYAVTLNPPNGGGTFNNHPVCGVSWYGAVKYCNWLTIVSGRGISERCYKEGPNAVDWYPVTARAWETGHFTSQEREAWLLYRGFRLPMGDYGVVTKFDEYYKAGAWNGTTSSLYGFGRSAVTSNDANYQLSRDLHEPHTTPVGYYDGSLHEYQGNLFQTAPNENHYGIFDLSGNAAEWLTKGTHPGTPPGALRGGGWSVSGPLQVGPGGTSLVHPSSAFGQNGFRVVATYP